MERKGAAKPLVALHVLCIGIKPRTQPLGPSSPYGVGTGAWRGLWVGAVELGFIEREPSFDGARSALEVVSKNPIGHC